MNSHNIPECHAFLNKITTIAFPFLTWLQSVRPHLGKHEVATITKKQPLKYLLCINKRPNVSPSINATLRININAYQISGKLSIKQEAFLLKLLREKKNSYDMNYTGQNRNFKLCKQFHNTGSGNLWFSVSYHPTKT